MQKSSLTAPPNNREASVRTGGLLAGSPPAVMPSRKGNSHYAFVTDLHAGESRNKAYTKEAAYYSNIVCYASSHSIAQIIKNSFKANSLVFSL